MLELEPGAIAKVKTDWGQKPEPETEYNIKYYIIKKFKPGNQHFVILSPIFINQDSPKSVVSFYHSLPITLPLLYIAITCPKSLSTSHHQSSISSSLLSIHCIPSFISFYLISVHRVLSSVCHCHHPPSSPDHFPITVSSIFVIHHYLLFSINLG